MKWEMQYWPSDTHAIEVNWYCDLHIEPDVRVYAAEFPFVDGVFVCDLVEDKGDYFELYPIAGPYNTPEEAQAVAEALILLRR